ncbi:MAG: GreA/GreB family elongation factor [Pseudomonadota bacterium]
MSRAFVKEPDGDETAGELPDLPLSPHPNYVTPEGLAALEARRATLEAERRTFAGDELSRRPALTRLAREQRYIEARLASAILVEAGAEAPEAVGFGCWVTVADEDDVEFRVRIVSEDEADPAHGKVSWVSPLARALEGAEVGDLVTWPKPSGPVELEVLAIGT